MNRRLLKFAMAGVLSVTFAEMAGAQTYFTNSGYGDLVAGFRKTGTYVENYELVVYLGNITNFINLSVGTTIPITNYSTAQINYMCPDNLTNLQWSVSSTFTAGIGLPWTTPVGSFPSATCWQTQPRTSFATQSTPPKRLTSGDSTSLRQRILAVSQGAAVTGSDLGGTNQYNNALLVEEPATYDVNNNTYTKLVADPSDASIGDFDLYSGYNIENITPPGFSSAQRSDLFQFVPNGSLDPLSGQSTGTAYYLGYFTLNTDGTMTFTRDTQSVVIAPPPPPRLTISSSYSTGSQTSTISFVTTNGATYTLYYTNASGLTTPMSNWPTIGTTITGDGAVHAFTNSSSDANRFYGVGAH